MVTIQTHFFNVFSDGESATFDGKSSITYDLSGQNEYVQTRVDYLKLRFLTDKQDGLLFYADSNQGDYMVLEMVHGRLYFHIDLGSQRIMYNDVLQGFEITFLCFLESLSYFHVTHIFSKVKAHIPLEMGFALATQRE